MRIGWPTEPGDGAAYFFVIWARADRWGAAGTPHACADGLWRFAHAACASTAQPRLLGRGRQGRLMTARAAPRRAPSGAALHWACSTRRTISTLNMDWFWETAEPAEIADTYARAGPRPRYCTCVAICASITPASPVGRGASPLRVDPPLSVGGLHAAAYGVAHAALVPLYYPYRWLRALRGAR
jgi:hypothetical protein